MTDIDRLAAACERIAAVMEKDLADRLEAQRKFEERQAQWDAERGLAALVDEVVPRPPDPNERMIEIAEKMLKRVLGPDDGE